MARQRALGLLVVALALAGCHARAPGSREVSSRADVGSEHRGAPAQPPAQLGPASYDGLVYRDYHQLDFSSLPAAKVPIPASLARQLAQAAQPPLLELRDPGRFEAQVLRKAQQLAPSGRPPDELGAAEALKLAMDIVDDCLDPHPVDEDPRFLLEHGDALPIDEYFRLGRAGPNEFALGLIAVFAILKPRNPNLHNVYVADNDFGDIDDDSDLVWNCIVLARPGAIVVSHIDLASGLRGGLLEAERGVYVPTDELEFEALFFEDVKEHARSYAALEKLYRDCRPPSCEPERKRALLKRMASAAYHQQHRHR